MVPGNTDALASVQVLVPDGIKSEQAFGTGLTDRTGIACAFVALTRPMHQRM